MFPHYIFFFFFYYYFGGVDVDTEVSGKGQKCLDVLECCKTQTRK